MISQNDAGQISIKNHDGTFFDMSKHVGCQLYVAPVPAVPAPSVPEEWLESVSELLTHIEDVVDDELWQKICATKWNNVSALLQSAEGYSSQTHSEVRHD